MKILKKSGLYSVIILTLTAVLFSNCKKDNEPAPQIPPIETFVIDFSDFDDGSKSVLFNSVDLRGVDTVTYDNWGFAGANVVIWNTILTIGLAVPVASFVESFNHEGVYQPDDNSWIWTYDVLVGLTKYTAELHAEIINDYVHWKMYISQQGGYSDFLWYTGESKSDRTEGTWTLYNTPNDPAPLLGIDWHRSSDNTTGDIRYTNIVPYGAENGGYISHAITTETPFDANYDIYNKGQDNLTEIEWNRAVKDGRITDMNHFGDEEWHCWDNLLQDIDCN